MGFQHLKLFYLVLLVICKKTESLLPTIESNPIDMEQIRKKRQYFMTALAVFHCKWHILRLVATANQYVPKFIDL